MLFFTPLMGQNARTIGDKGRSFVEAAIMIIRPALAVFVVDSDDKALTTPVK